MIREDGVITRRGAAVLRVARSEDLSSIDAITVTCYRDIHESYVAMLGPECYDRVRNDPELTWEERKTRQNRNLFRDHPQWLWVLEEDGRVFGFVTFLLFPEQGFGHIENNGIAPDRAGQGWGKFMYRHVLQRFRDEGLRFAHVETGLDPVHAPARRAYQDVGFNREVPSIEYWQDLESRNPGSVPD